MVFTQEHMLTWFNNNIDSHQVCFKVTENPLKYRICATQEQIATITRDGLETVNTANPGDYIVTNPGGEQYVITPDRVTELYHVDHVNGVLNVLSKPRTCIQNTSASDTVKFIAPWGGEMVLKPNDYLVSIEGTEVYRVAEEEFKQTYKLGRKFKFMCESENFNLIETGIKHFEYLRNYQNYQIGDLVEFHECDDSFCTITGRIAIRQITYIQIFDNNACIIQFN